MSRVNQNDLFREIKDNAIDNSRKNSARTELYYQLSENQWDNGDVDSALKLAEVFYYYHYEINRLSASEALIDAVDDLMAYLSSALADEIPSIRDELSRDALDGMRESLRMGQDIIDAVRRSGEDSRRDQRRYGRSYNERDYDQRSRRYEGRGRNVRRERGYDPVRSRGRGIGRGRDPSEARRYAQDDNRRDEPVSRRYSPPASENTKYSDRRSPPQQNAPTKQPEAPESNGPKHVLQQSQPPALFDLNTKVAHEFYEIGKYFPLYELNGKGDVVNESHVLTTSKTGENIKASDMNHKDFLFFTRRGTTLSTGDLEHAQNVYRRMSQRAVKLDELLPVLSDPDGSVRADPNAEFPTVLNTVPFVVEVDFCVTNELSDISKATILIDHVNECLTPLNPNYDYSNSIIITNFKYEYQFILEASSNEDADYLFNTFNTVSKRNNVASVVAYLEMLSARLPMREWNILNNSATAMFNDVAKIEFGLPEGVDSLYLQLKDYMELVAELFGERISEALSDQLHRVVLSTLNMNKNVVGEGQLPSFSIQTESMIVLLPIESRDVEIGLAHESPATGIVSQTTMPYLHAGLSNLLKHTKDSIRKICIFTRDAEMVTLHHSKHTDAILLHRE